MANHWQDWSKITWFLVQTWLSEDAFSPGSNIWSWCTEDSQTKWDVWNSSRLPSWSHVHCGQESRYCTCKKESDTHIKVSVPWTAHSGGTLGESKSDFLRWVRSGWCHWESNKRRLHCAFAALSGTEHLLEGSNQQLAESSHSLDNSRRSLQGKNYYLPLLKVRIWAFSVFLIFTLNWSQNQHFISMAFSTWLISVSNWFHFDHLDFLSSEYFDLLFFQLPQAKNHSLIFRSPIFLKLKKKNNWRWVNQ